MFTKILVANDGSTSAGKAVEVAADLVARSKAELWSISVEDNLPKYPGAIGEVQEVKAAGDGYFARVNEEATALAATKGVELKHEVRAGQAAETIAEYAHEKGADLLVIGSADHSALLARFIGSTSQDLMRLSPCGVLVVK